MESKPQHRVENKLVVARGERDMGEIHEED